MNIFLSVITLMLGIATFILVYKTYKKEHTVNLQVNGRVEKYPFNQVDFDIKNWGDQSFIITSYSIGIGSTPDRQKILVEKIDQNIKLYHGDTHKDCVERTEIIRKYKEYNIPQLYKQQLWLNVTSSLNHTVSNNIYINSTIIQNKYYQSAEKYIATDIFLGLPQMKSEIPSSHLVGMR